MRELTTSLCHVVDYQYRLRADFRRRRVHPAVETLVWSHVIGKPTERVQLSADVTMNQKLNQERELSVNGDASLSDYFRQKRRFQRLDSRLRRLLRIRRERHSDLDLHQNGAAILLAGCEAPLLQSVEGRSVELSSSDWTISRRVGTPSRLTTHRRSNDPLTPRLIAPAVYWGLTSLMSRGEDTPFPGL